MRSGGVLGSAVMPFSKEVGFPKLTGWGGGKEQGNGRETPAVVMVSPWGFAVLHFLQLWLLFEEKGVAPVLELGQEGYNSHHGFCAPAPFPMYLLLVSLGCRMKWTSWTRCSWE